MITNRKNDKPSLRIAFCFSELRPENTTDTSFLQQLLITNGLKALGHTLTYIAQTADRKEVICTEDIRRPDYAARTWSKTLWFDLARKVSWRAQQLVHIPYLNVFTNLSHYDACLRVLPGHDVVHERNGIYKMGVAMACRRLKIPYVFFFDADDILEHDLFGMPLGKILRWRAQQALRYNLKTSARVICVSNLAKSRLMSTWKVPQEKIVVLPNAVDVDLFRPYPEKRDEIRKKFNVEGSPVILFVGSFFPYQDLVVLLDAYAELIKDSPEVRLILVGKGEQYEKTVQYAKELGIYQSVIFAGFQPHSEIPHILDMADVAVAPYRKVEDEIFLGSPMKLFEYMASGVASIASNIGQISEIIEDGVNGLLVPPEDPHALAVALRRLLDSPDLRSQLGQKARRDVVEKYSWQQYISQIDHVYKDAISAGER